MELVTAFKKKHEKREFLNSVGNSSNIVGTFSVYTIDKQKVVCFDINLK